jgi:hypothetical protein
MRIDELSLEADEAPEFDEDGYTSLQSPAEEEEAFEGLLDSGLSEQEAQETVDYMRPLSEDEEAILAEHPELEGVTMVDDADQEKWLGEKFNEGTKAMDRVLEDASYGEGNMRDEEQMERNDSDDESGLSFRRAFRKIGRGVKRGVRGAARGVGKVARSPFKLAKKFVPNRDKAKAKLVKNLYRKLWFEHANWLAQQDKSASVPLKTRAEYEQVAKLWARSEIAKRKLPMKYAVSGAVVVGSDIMGGEVMGAWWNPFSWFQSQVKVVMADTQAQRSDVPPEEQSADAQLPGDTSLDVQDPSAESYPEESTDEAGWNGVRQAASPHDPVADNLGAFAAHVLGKDLPARDNPSVDEIVRGLVAKLKTGQAISPGEVGLLSSAAREGNEGARKVVTVLRARGAVVSGDDSGLDPWMYKLNPAYWIASKRKREFVDKEKKAWKDNAHLREKLEKQQQDLDAAERATRAAEAVEQAKAQSADTEAKLQAIASSLKGSMAGAIVGHEEPTPISEVVAKALEETGKREVADKLYAKIRGGQSLSKEELLQARQVARVVGKVRVVHGGLLTSKSEKEEVEVMHGAFVGACAIGGIAVALDQNDKQQKSAEHLAGKVASGKPLQQAERDGLAAVLRGQQELKKFTASLVSGRALRGCPESWVRGAFVGAARAMSPGDKEMLAAIVKLAKVGNPRAAKALAVLRKTGEVSGGDGVVGLSLSKAFKYATAPVWLPLKGVAKGAKWVGKKTGIVKGKSSPEQVRLNRLRAAQKRASAAAARARAADSQNEAEYRAQQAIADAADAEADAQDAEATAKEQAMRTAEVEAAPNLQADDSSEGASEDAEKARALTSLYKLAKIGDPKAFKAVEDLVAKAKSGDKQALLDVKTMKGARSYTSDPSDYSSQGSFVGGWTSRLGKDSKGAKAVAKAAEKSPAGQKVRGAAVVYKRAKAGDPKAVKAVEAMVARAKAGDQQALRDVNAMKVARIAVESRKWAKEQEPSEVYRRAKAGDRRAKRAVKVLVARAKKGDQQATRDVESMKAERLAMAARKQARKVQKRELVAKVRAARRAKVVAAQKRFEASAAERLARMSRKRELQKLAAVERKAAAGEPKARAFVSSKVACAKKGDRKAKAQVQAMRLGRAARLHQQSTKSSWRSERKNMRAARFLARGILANKPGAVRQYEVIKAAAAQGNPNAKRGLERIALQLAVLRTIQTGVVSLPKTKKKRGKPVPGTPQFAEARKQVEAAKEQGKAGTATREELVAKARVAQDLGDQKSAGTLNQLSSSAPSATEGVKKAAGTVAAAQAGNPDAKASLDKDLAAAREGNPDAINKLGQVAAARAVAAVEAGQPVPQPMRDAINLQERARAGDPAAQEVLQRVSEAATSPSPSAEATTAAAYATGAAALASSLASKPQARRELMERVNAPVPREEQSAAQAQLAAIVQRTNEGTVTPAEGQQGVELAMRMRQPRVAALISAKAPPLDVDAMSSLPDSPLPPIAGAWELFKATLKALTFTTPDPLGNYREGIATRSRVAAVESGSAGWSPFSFFKRFKPALPALAMLSAPVTAAAALANLRGRKAAPAPAARPATAAPAAPAAPARGVESESPSASAGADDFRDLVARALKDKKVSRRDLDKAVDANPVSRTNPTARKALAEQVRKFLTDRKVVVSGDEAPAGDVKVFRVLVTQALRDKKMSRDDFNKTVSANLPPTATRGERTLAAARVLHFLEKRGVRVG